MAEGRLFENVLVYIIENECDRKLKYEDSVSVRLEYDPHGLSCKVYKDGAVDIEIPIDTKTECCKMGSKSYVFASHEDLQITFSSSTDAQKFHEIIFKMRQGKEASVFTERTDDSSATQYFQFYSYLSQQQNMMQDYIRTGTYQQAILSNSNDFKGKVVLDVGAGSGILSFFAAQAGAATVYAVEASSMAYHCQNLVKSNNLEDTIKVIAGKIEEIELPSEVDIIISEPMGYMLYNERMLESYIHARKWLKPNGKMYPSRGDLHVAPFFDEGLYFEQLNKANFWYQNCFHGVDLSNLRDEALAEYLRQPIVDTFDINICLAKSVRHSLDFVTADESDLHLLEIPLEFHILKSSMMHGLAFWFDVAFLGGTQTVWLSTAPTEPLTHWYQVRCLLEKPLFVKEGNLVTGKVQLIANRRQSYDVKIFVNIEGSNVSSSNTLDLKNPYFRYTGVAPQPPPGNCTTSPSENYWHEMDEQGAKQALNMVNGITVNGLGEVAIDQNSQLIQLGGGNIQIAPNMTPLSPTGAVKQQQQQQQQQQQRQLPASNSNTYSNMQQLVHPMLRQGNNSSQSSTSAGVSGGSNTFPLNSSLMIGDYATPGNLLLPTQGLQIQPPSNSH